MASEIQARAIISAVDRTAGPLGRIAGRFRAFGNRLGLDRLNRQMANVGRATANVGRQIRRIGTLAVGAAAVAGGAAVAITRSWANATDELVKFARQIGVPVNLLHEMEHAAKLTGAEFGNIKNALDRMVRTAGDGSLVRAIGKINPELAEVLRGTETAEEAFEAIMRVLAETEDVAERNALAYAAFGRSGAAAMVRLAEGGVEAFEEMREESRRLRGSISRDAGANAEAFNDSITRVMASIEGLRNAIGERLAPVLTPLLNDLAEWIASNRELIGQKVTEWVERVGKWASELAVRLPDLIARIEGLIGSVRDVVEAIGGWEVALAGVAVVISSQLILALVNLGKEIVKLGALLLATPIGWVFVGIGLAIAGIIKKWDEFKDAVSQGIGGLKDAVGGFADWWVGFWTGDFERSAQGVRRFFSGINDFAEGAILAISAPLRGIIALFEEWTGWDLTGPFRSAFEAVDSVADRIGTFVDDAIAELLKLPERVRDGISGALGAMGGLIEEYIVAPIKSLGAFVDENVIEPFNRLLDIDVSGWASSLLSDIDSLIQRFEDWTGIDVSGWISGIAGGFRELADGAVGRAAEIVGNVVQAFRDLLDIDIAEWARSIGSSFREYVIRPFEDFASFLRNSRLGQWLGFADDVEEEGEDAAERARVMGQKVGSMVAQGMRDAKPEIDAAARDMTQGIADYLPQSPAKKGPLRRLVKMGQEIVAQLRRGIDLASSLLPRGLVDGIASAVNGMGRSVARGAQAVFEAPGRAIDNIREMASGPFKALLDMIGSVEAPRGYNQIFGGAERRLGRQDLTGMTIREVQDLQNRMVRSGAGSSAVGRYQIIRGTLNSLINELGLSGDEKFDEKMQDRLGTALLQRRGLRRFMEGSMSASQFGNNLSKEWAALPFMTGNRRGRSYYHGDRMGNRAHLAPSRVEQTLTALRNPPRTPRPENRPELERQQRSERGRGDVNITVSSMTLNAENPQQAADQFWRELERRRGSSMRDSGID